MRFVLNMAWRELRSSWHRLLLFFLCIAIGVASMVSVRSLTEQVTVSIARQSRALFAADVRAESNQPWQPDARALLQEHGSSPLVTAHTQTIETQTMARIESDGESRPLLVELKAVEPAYPLHGEIRLLGGAPYSHALVENGGVVVSPNLLARLGRQVGDRIRIGTRTFTIRAAADRIPGSVLNFSPMPRVIVDYPAAADAGLTGFGSRVRRVWLFKTLEGREGAVARAIGRTAQEKRLRMSIGTFHYVENWLTRSISNMEGFIALVGLSILVLGGIGIASVTRVFIQQKLRTIAILKCLGGRNRPVLGAYLAQSLALGLVGSLFGVLLAEAVSAVGVGRLAARLPFDLAPGLTWRASLQGVGLGVLVALLFSVPPLLDIRHVKPASVLRQDSGPRGFDWLQLAARVILALGVVAMAVWQAGTYPRVGVFIGGLAATALLLNIAGTALMAMLRRLGHMPSFVLRHGVGSLHRPGNQTKVILFAVGIGVLFMVAVRLQQVNMQGAYSLDLGSLAADMFLIDLQEDQRAEAETLFASLAATDVRLIPVVRARVVGARRHGSRREPEEVLRRRTGGEFRVTYRPGLEKHETIVAGALWDSTPSANAEISLEEDLARWLALEVGDSLIVDVAGRRFEPRVTSVRRMERRVRSFSWLTRFDVVFRPGLLEAAPHMFVGALKGPRPGGARARLQNAFLDRFPNVTLVDALDDIEEIRTRIDDLSLAVSLLGAFVYVCGVLVLVGSIAMTKLQRVYEAAILKTLGARKSVIVRIAAIEYAVLGALAGLIGSGASIAVTWAMAASGRTRIPWHFQPSINITGVAATVLLVTAVGVLASWDVIVRKPLAILREQ